MVKMKEVVLFALIFLRVLNLYADDNISITAEINAYGVYENQPIPGTINVNHDESVRIDPNAFTLEGKPLQVQLVKELRIEAGNPLLLSIYSFNLPPKPAGLHVLPEISMKVGKKVYKTIPSSFAVTAGSGNNASAPEQPEQTPVSTPAPAPSAPAATYSPPSLKLEAKVEGPDQLYPGQQAKIVYRYIYSGDIQLTTEKLPLLDAAGFIKIGPKETKEYTEGGYSVLEVWQIIQAQKPGNYPFAASVLEGTAADAQGQSLKLHAETPAQTLTVVAFPVKGKPASFKGALGKFTIHTSLQGPSTVNLGDKISLAVDISGTTSEWSSVNLPDICCQPGFSGFFRLDDLPPAGQMEGSTKHYVVGLRALSPNIKEIPSVEFSSFDPISQSYVTSKSDPIPLIVSASQNTSPPPPSKSPPSSSAAVPENTQNGILKPGAIEIEGNLPLTGSDLKNKHFTSWWDLLLIPLGILALIWQVKYKQELLIKKQTVKLKTSADIFAEALQASPDSADFYRLLNQAFLTRLVERGELKSPETSWEDLPENGTASEVRGFLMKINEQRFSGKKEQDPQELVKEAQVLFDKLKESS